MIRSHLTQPGYRSAIFWVAALPVLYFISRYNYNLFHSLVDGASIIIAASVFVIIWNVRRILDNDYFLYVGISFLFFAFLDLMHVLGNKNMGVFPEYGNLGPAFYIASRYILSISLLIAPLFINRKLNSTIMFALYSVFTSFILLSIFYWRIFPVCIVEGVGLTPFKVISDYVICFIFLGAIGLLLIKRRSFDPGILRIIVSSIILFIATGVAFTLYADPFGIMNAVGHFLQIASFYLVYLAIIETSLTKPQDVLYRKLKQSEEKLAEKVKQLDYANVELKQEITERKRAEEELRQSREWLRVTLSSIGDAVIAVDTEGRITFLNPVAGSLTGWQPAEAVGRPIGTVFRIMNEETHKPAEDIIHKVLVEGRATELANHTALIHRDGSEIPIADSAAPIKDSSLNLLGVVIVFRDVTERRLAQNALRRSAENLRVVADFAYDWEYWRSPDNRFLYVSPSCERITGYSREEFLKDPNYLSRIIHPEDRERILEHLREDQSQQEPCEFEFRILRRDGHVRWIAHACQPVLGENERMLGRRASNRDITERKQMEERLRESEERYRTLFGTMTEGFALHEIIIDAQGRPCDYRFLDVNPAFERQTGLKREDLVGKSVLEVLPRTESHWIENFGRVALTGDPLHMENYSATLGRWYEVLAYRPAPGRFAVVFSDITERKRAGEALKQSEQRYRSLHAELELRVRERTAELQSTLTALEESESRFREVLENSLDAAYRRNLQTDRYDYMSPAMASISGYAPEELFEMTTEEVVNLIHPDDAAPVKAHIEECLIKEETQSFLEYRFRHKGGSYRWFSDFIAIVKDSCGRPLYRVGTVRDITIRKRSEQELKKYSSKLEMINQKLKEFVFVAAHDLNEPLRKIQTFGSLLEAKTADRLDEQERDYISRMTGAADRMRELLDALLKYSRLDAKEQEFKPAKLDGVVRDAVTDLEVVIRKIEARIKINKLPTVMGDPYQLRHLFHNLIGNSLKYHRPEVKTLVRVYGEDNDGDCRIFVEDNGIGFDEKYLDRIFKPFQRLHGKNEYPGTGIGLAICQKIVERHKGAITARSTPGKGSTFIVTLPVDGTKVARKPE